MLLHRSKTPADTTLRATDIVGYDSYSREGRLMNIVGSLLVTLSVALIAVLEISSFHIFSNDEAYPIYIYFSEGSIIKFYAALVIGCLAICAVGVVVEKWYISLMILVTVYAAPVVINYKQIINGFIHFLNKVFYTYDTIHGGKPDLTYYPAYETNSPKTELTAFMYAALFGLCFILSYLGMSRMSVFWYSVVVMAFAALPLALECTEHEWIIAALAASCIVMYTIGVQGYNRASKKSGVTRTGLTLLLTGRFTALAAAQHTVILAAVTAALFLVMSVMNAFSDYQRDPVIDRFGKDLLHKAQVLTSGSMFENFGFGTSPRLNQGRLSRLGDIEYHGDEMFTVSFDGSVSSLYLRSYCAADYTSSRWKPVSDSEYRSYDFWDELEKSAFYPQFEHPEASGYLYNEKDLVTVTIENIDMRSKVCLTDCRAVPWARGSDILDASSRYDGMFTYDIFFAPDEYRQKLYQPEYPASDITIYGDIPSVTDISRMNKLLRGGDVSSRAMELSSVVDMSAVENFKRNELSYREFAAAHYLDYPDDITAWLPADFDAHIAYFYEQSRKTDGAFELDDYYDSVCAYVRGFLASSTEYTLSPGNTPRGRDFVEYFLNENHKGYCVHYATAAALMLRRAGIPARYCEGFYVSRPDDPETGRPSKTVTVEDNSSHAWVEIYYPLAGWYTAEFTTPFAHEIYGDFSTDTDEFDTDSQKPDDSDDTTDTDDTETDTETETDTDTSTDTAADTDSDTQSDSDSDRESIADTTSQSDSGTPTGGSIDLSGIKSFLAIIMLLAVWFTAYHAVRKLRRLSFEQSDGRKAALSMYAYALRLLKVAGITQQSGEGDEAFALRTAGTIPVISSQQWRDFADAALSARFGRTAPDNTKLSSMRDTLEKLYPTVTDNLPKHKLFVIKYIMFLG